MADLLLLFDLHRCNILLTSNPSEHWAAEEVMAAYPFYGYGVTKMLDLTVAMAVMGAMLFSRYLFATRFQSILPIPYNLITCTSFIATKTSHDVNNLNHITSLLKAEDGVNGRNKDCHGKNADHQIVKVPVGTIVKNALGQVVGDLNENGVMFVAARGGAGGKGNPFFITDMEQAPQICEYGAQGEDLSYIIELRSMAHLGLVCEYLSIYSAAAIVKFGKCNFLDWITERWQKYVATSDNQSQTQGGQLSVHNAKAAHRDGRVFRLRTNCNCRFTGSHSRFTQKQRLRHPISETCRTLFGIIVHN